MTPELTIDHDALAQPRLRVLLAGERLFAEHGIEAVSLRQIATAAAHGNTNAVQYHFKSKLGLVQAIFTHRIAEMEVYRKEMLDAAERDGLQSDALALLKILALPHLKIVDEQGMHPFAHFLAQYLLRYQGPKIQNAGVQPASETTALRDLFNLLESRIGYVPRRTASARIELCTMMFINMIVLADNDPAIDPESADFQELVEDTLEMMLAAFATPYRPATRHHERPRLVGDGSLLDAIRTLNA